MSHIATRKPATHAATRTVGLLAVAVAVMVAVLAGVSALAVATAPPASAQPTRTIGAQPLADIREAARNASAARPACKLRPDRLAAMMLAPVLGETGAIYTPGIAPSPMTLSRWDNQDQLYAFGNRNTRYRKAFWHPGIGMWQFDSAGLWNLTAADAINTARSAPVAANVMADRYCTATGSVVARMNYAWGPWYACRTHPGGNCVDLFRQLFVNGRLANITTTPAVTRTGGMQRRSCQVGTRNPVPCHRVDPARAQGLSSWAAEVFGPTPITAPFYVVRLDGREMRYWLSADTGYDRSVRATKPVRANARTSLTWQTTGPAIALCDVSVRRGDCAAAPAPTPPPPPAPKPPAATRNPQGMLDGVQVLSPTRIRVRGWAADPDTTRPIDVHVYVNGRLARAFAAGGSRPDVPRALPQFGPNHGFNRVVPVVAGRAEVCAYAINVGPGTTNPSLGCRTVTVPPPVDPATRNPIGSVDEVRRVASGNIRVAGWAADPDRDGPIRVQAWVNGRLVRTFAAGGSRPDVARALPQFGPNHGFNRLIGVGAGRAEVCLVAVNVGPGTTNPTLGCRVR